MNSSDREGLRRAITARLHPAISLIDLSGEPHWEISEIRNPLSFFEHLPALMPTGSVLYVEGTNIAPAPATFYSDYLCSDPVPIVSDILFPKPQIFHLAFSDALCAGLTKLANGRPSEDLFHHIKGYQDRSVIFTFHDAFSGVLRVTREQPESVIFAFCNALNARYKFAATEPPAMDALAGFLKLLGEP